ncbi:glycosyltransferase [Maribacter chungangensis]|uniref:Glycosyltransferase n=1 Tax=Maribacter chungangensis TaxID=1069117 RepID=A0ABW3B8T4_9FLAO
MDFPNYYVYSNFDFSQKSAGATRMLYYAKALANKNQAVFLVSCCKTNFNLNDFEEVEPNIFVLKNKKLTTSLLFNIIFLQRLFKFSKKHKRQNRFIFYPSPLVYLEVLALVYLKGIKQQQVFCELNEIRLYSSSFHDPITFARPLYSLKKIVYKIVFFLIQYLLYFYTGIICISTSIEHYARKYNSKTIRIPILTDPFLELKPQNNSAYSKKGYFNVGFSGTIHPSKENLLNFIKTVDKLFKKGHKIVFNLCGHVYDKDFDLIFNNEEFQLEINYYGNLNQNELSTFLLQQNLLVIPRGYTLQNKFGFSTKLSDYLNHKKVILLTDISDNSLYIKDGINGYIVPPNDNKAMFEKIAYIIKNFKENEKSIIENAYTTSLENFYFKIQSERLHKFLD